MLILVLILCNVVNHFFVAKERFMPINVEKFPVVHKGKLCMAHLNLIQFKRLLHNNSVLFYLFHNFDMNIISSEFVSFTSKDNMTSFDVYCVIFASALV